MSKYIRPKIPGARIFFMVALAQRGTDTLVREIDCLRAAVRATHIQRPFSVDAWVVLPDHIHAIWTLPDDDKDFSTRWGAIKARFSMTIRRAGFTPPTPPFLSDGEVNPALRKGQVGIWQKRFWEHHIRNDDDYSTHLQYCWMNPVKHGFVQDPADWPYSSYHRDIQNRKRRAGFTPPLPGVAG